MKKLIFWLMLASFHAANATTTSETILPVADIGANQNPHAQTISASRWNHGWLKFDLSHLSDTVESATIKIHPQDSGIKETTLWQASDDNWDEDTSTPAMAGQPWLGGYELGKMHYNGTPWLELDITDFVNQKIISNGLVSIEISNQNSSWKNYYSLQSHLSPKLDVVKKTGETVAPIPPKAIINLSQYGGEAPLNISVSAGNSVYSDDENVKFNWQLSSGEQFFGENWDYEFQQPGDYSLELTLISDTGLEHSSSVNISITAATVQKRATKMGKTRQETTLTPQRISDARGQNNAEKMNFSRWDHAFVEFNLENIAAFDGAVLLELSKLDDRPITTHAEILNTAHWPAQEKAPTSRADRGAKSSSSAGRAIIDVSNLIRSHIEQQQDTIVFALSNDSNQWVPYLSAASNAPPRLHFEKTSTVDTGMIMKKSARSGVVADLMLSDMDSKDDMSHMGMDMPMLWGNAVNYGPEATLLPTNTGSAGFDIHEFYKKPTDANPVGAFRNRCLPSHYNYDDPVVFPGKIDATHLHLFFGNTETDAHSTYESLRSNGNSTCRGGTANRTAYWVPAMMNKLGDVINPEYIDVYYKTGYNGTSPATIKTVPDGLRMIAGNAMSVDPQPAEVVNFQCEDYSPNRSIPDCESSLTMEITFPQCWDGVNLDSSDHKSHMAYPSNGCPASHPVALPVIAYKVVFNTAGSSKGWRLSSDMYEGDEMGHSAHADWFEAWEPEIKEAWTAECLNKSVDCGSHMLGDGRMMF